MRSNILKRINVIIKKVYYTHERFQINTTFAMLYYEEPLNVVELAKYVRISDQLIQLDENHYFIVFEFTSHNNAYKASQNIINSLDIHFNNNACCIALDSFNPSISPQNVLNRLKMILTEIRKNTYIRIETEEILDR